MSALEKLQHRLAGDIAVYGIFGAARHFISFLFLPLYVHILNTQEFGALDIIITIVSLINLIILQFNVGYARYYYRNRSERRQKNYVKTMFCFFSGCGLVVAVFFSPVAYILGNYIFGQIEGGGFCLGLITLSLLPQVIVEFALINMRLERKNIRFGMTNVADATLRGAVIVFFIWVLHMGLAGYALGLFVANCVVSFTVLRYLRKSFQGGRFEKNQFKEIGRFTYPSLPGVILGYANQYGGRFIMFAFLTLKEIALYALAMKLAKIMKMFVHSFRQAWLPVAMEEIYNPRGSEFYAKIFDWYAFVTVLILIIITSFAKPVVQLIAPESYQGAAVFVPYLVAGVLISAASAIVDIGNQISEKTQWISIATSIGTFVNLSIGLLLTRKLGGLAVAAGFMLGSVASMFVLFFASYHNHRIPFRWHSFAIIVVGIPAFIMCIFH